MAKADDNAIYRRQLLLVVKGIFIFCIIGAIYVARDFLLPVTLAFFIATTFRPAIRWLALRGVPAGATATGFAASLMLGGFLTGYMLSRPISGWIADAPEFRTTFIEKVRRISAPLEQVAKITSDIKNAATANGAEPPNEVAVKDPGMPALLWVAAYPASYTLMFSGAVILSLFLMASGNLLYEKLLRIMPTLTDKKNALRIVQDVERDVSLYLLNHTGINAGVGVAVGLSFFLIGMPTAYLWAFLAFTFNFVPYAGPTAGITLSWLISFVVFDSFSYSLLAPVIYIVVVMIESQFVSPIILGRRLRLNSVAILLTLAFWGWIWGIPGVIVAVPLLVTLRVFSSHFDSLTPLGEFLSEASSSNAATVESPITEKKI